MIRLLIKNWWLLFLRGLLAIAFAIFIYAFLPFLPMPFLRQFALSGLTAIFSLFACGTGVLTILAAVRGVKPNDVSWPLLAEGIGVTIGGLVILLLPGLTLIHVIRLIAAIALVLGILEVVAGVHLRRHVRDEWLLITGGIISLAFGAVLFADARRQHSSRADLDFTVCIRQRLGDGGTFTTAAQVANFHPQTGCTQARGTGR